MSNGLNGWFVVTALLASACSGNSANSSGAESNEAAFKSSEASYVHAGAGVTTLIDLPFVAPSDGFVSASATGSCSVIVGLPVKSELAAEIETTASGDQLNSGDALFDIGAFGQEPTEGSFSTLRVIPATAGDNALYLNLDNPSSGGTLSCSASMTVLFAPQQLP